MKKWLILLISWWLVLPAWALEATPTENDPVAQKRAVELELKLRCLVCQNQSIAESDAELAVDLRRQVRHFVAEGKSDEEIIQFMTDRYGDFVLYQPPVKTTTVLLWAGPIVLLLLGLASMLLLVRRYSKSADQSNEQLSAAEEARATALIEGRDEL
ncbi:MAG: cytochrome c-type biogenesis protein CcmH [Burkholderiales bacterium]|jgi:cytochrome c-type biogenesis protein CcmH|nr:cytochrome c-type biogenesis protein CcmH [Burkholderiales bacterium]